MGNWLLPSRLPLRFGHVGRASAQTRQHVLSDLKCPHMSVLMVEVGRPDERLIVLIFLEGEAECVFEHDFADHVNVDEHSALSTLRSLRSERHCRQRSQGAESVSTCYHASPVEGATAFLASPHTTTAQASLRKQRHSAAR